MSFFRVTFRLFQKNFNQFNNKNNIIFDKATFYSNRNRKGFLFGAATMITTTNFNDNNTTVAAFLTTTKPTITKTKPIINSNCGNFQSPYYQQQIRNFSTNLQNKNLTLSYRIGTRTICTHEITKNLTLFSESPRNVDLDQKTLKLKEQVERPLTLMFGWLLAKKRNLAKYAKIYTDLGFDVLTVEITPWQLLWPVKGSQIVALDVLKFLENNPLYTPIVLHGFSVGGYMWGEVMVHMTREMERYKPILDRISAQVWDSAADITEIPIGVPKSIFPKNQTLQKALRNYTIYHLKTFHEQATCHYIRSSQLFHSPLSKSPVLFFVSKNDLIGAEKSNLSVKEDMESIGIKCTWKCWERSGHTQHYRYHHEEYMKYLLNHLENNVMGRIAEKKTQAKM